MDAKLFRIARSGDANSLDADHTLHLKKTHHKGNTALHIASRFGHADFAAKIVARCPDLLLAETSREDTALQIAARAGHVGVVLKLIELGEEKGDKGSMLKKVNKEQNTVLHEAAANRNDKVVELLIKEEPKLVFEANEAGASPLYVAAERGCVGSVVLILNVMKDREEANWEGPHGRTPLHAAVIRGDSEIAKKLIDVKKKVIRQKDCDGFSPLHYAVAFGSGGSGGEMECMLLESDISSAYIGDNDNRTPLHWAACNGRVDIFKMLLRFCPDSAEAVDNKGWNALHIAAARGKVQVVKYILSSEDLEDLINEPNAEGDTPLHLALTEQQLPVLALLLKDRRVDVNLLNKKGKTAFDIASAELSSKRGYGKIIVYAALSRARGRHGGIHKEGIFRTSRTRRTKTELNVISTVAALVITVTFAAAFTIPGGFNSNEHQGKAVFASKLLFWLFIITDILAFASSICVEVLLFCSVVSDDDEVLLDVVVLLSMKFLAVSLVSLSLSLLFGLSLVVSKILVVIASLLFIVVYLLLGRWMRRFSWSYLVFGEDWKILAQRLLTFFASKCPRSKW